VKVSDLSAVVALTDPSATMTRWPSVVRTVVQHVELGHAPAVARVHIASWRQACRGLLPQAYLDSLSVETWTTTWAKAFSHLPDQTSTNLVGELDGHVVPIAHPVFSRSVATSTRTKVPFGDRFHVPSTPD